MPLYTIHAPAPDDGAATAPADLVFIKEGYCWPALLIPLIWTLYHRLWLVVLLLLAALLVFVAVAGPLGQAALALLLLGRIFYALEANGLRRWTLERNGYVLVGITEGRTLIEAERRFFTEWETDGAAYAPPAASPPATGAQAAQRPTSWSPSAAGPEVVGLFPTSGSAR